MAESFKEWALQYPDMNVTYEDDPPRAMWREPSPQPIRPAYGPDMSYEDVQQQYGPNSDKTKYNYKGEFITGISQSLKKRKLNLPDRESDMVEDRRGVDYKQGRYNEYYGDLNDLGTMRDQLPPMEYRLTDMDKQIAREYPFGGAYQEQDRTGGFARPLDPMIGQDAVIMQDTQDILKNIEKMEKEHPVDDIAPGFSVFEKSENIEGPSKTGKQEKPWYQTEIENLRDLQQQWATVKQSEREYRKVKFNQENPNIAAIGGLLKAVGLQDFLASALEHASMVPIGPKSMIRTAKNPSPGKTGEAANINTKLEIETPEHIQSAIDKSWDAMVASAEKPELSVVEGGKGKFGFEGKGKWQSRDVRDFVSRGMEEGKDAAQITRELRANFKEFQNSSLASTRDGVNQMMRAHREPTEAGAGVTPKELLTGSDSASRTGKFRANAEDKFKVSKVQEGDFAGMNWDELNYAREILVDRLGKVKNQRREGAIQRTIERIDKELEMHDRGLRDFPGGKEGTARGLSSDVPEKPNPYNDKKLIDKAHELNARGLRTDEIADALTRYYTDPGVRISAADVEFLLHPRDLFGDPIVTSKGNQTRNAESKTGDTISKDPRQGDLDLYQSAGDPWVVAEKNFREKNPNFDRSKPLSKNNKFQELSAIERARGADNEMEQLKFRLGQVKRDILGLRKNLGEDYTGPARGELRALQERIAEITPFAEKGVKQQGEFVREFISKIDEGQSQKKIIRAVRERYPDYKGSDPSIETMLGQIRRAAKAEPLKVGPNDGLLEQQEFGRTLETIGQEMLNVARGVTMRESTNVEDRRSQVESEPIERLKRNLGSNPSAEDIKREVERQNKVIEDMHRADADDPDSIELIDLLTEIAYSRALRSIVKTRFGK